MISLAVNVLMLAMPLYMLQIFDRVLTSRSLETLLALTILAAFALACQAMLDHARRVALTRLASWLEIKLGGHLVGASLLRSLRTGTPSAEGLRDLAVVKNYLAGGGALPLLDSPWTPIFLVAIFLLSPPLAVVAVGAMVLLLGLATLSEFLGRSGLQRAREIEASASQEMTLALQNADTVQAMGMMPALIERWNTASSEAVDSHERADHRMNFTASLAKMFRFAFQAAIFGIGAVLVLRGEFTPGGMIAVSILTARALAPIDGAVGAWRSGIQARDSWRRIQQLLGDAPQPKRVLALPRPDGDLELSEVSYVYPGLREPALRNVSFRLPKGQSLAIVGPAASGKSTLARLIVGNLVPAYGHVRLAGIELSNWMPEDKGKHVGYLAQDVELFAATVRENITRLTDTPEGVVEAAQLVGADEVISRLPQRYDTPLGSRGTVLSGGQKQSLGIARAVWGNPCLVVLDEPNSNLDQEGEAALTAGLARLKENGTTVVLVSHRPALLQQVDNVLVLRAGSVQAFGPKGTIIPRLIAPAAAKLAGTGT